MKYFQTNNKLSLFCLIAVWMEFSNAEKQATPNSKNTTTFSGPISKLPIKKLYIPGIKTPIYVRPMLSHPEIRRRSRARSQLAAPNYQSDGYENSVTSPPIQEPIYAPASQPNIGPGANVVSKFDEETYAPKKPKYPLPECYTNDSGFMCCNKELENVMDDALKDLKNKKNSGWHNCNVQQIANAIQKATESNFNLTFEVVTGIGDYASKSHFFHNYICKMERDERFILAYATPLPEGGLRTPSLGGSQNGIGSQYNAPNEVLGPPTQPQQNKAPYAHVYRW